MVTEYHRMIYYEPDVIDPDLAHGSLTALGNGAMVVGYGGLRLLADPWMGERAPRLSGTRVPDVILLSSLDAGEAALMRDTSLHREIPVLTTPDLVDPLERCGFVNVHPLDTWRGIALRKGDASLTVTALPGRHPTRPNRPLMGSMLELRGYPDAEPYRIYLSGGTGDGEHLDEIAAHYPKIDLAVIMLACTWLADAVVAVEATQGASVARRLQPGVAIPVHRFDDLFTWPVRDFQLALYRAGHPTRIRELVAGQRHRFPVSTRHPRESTVPAAPRGVTVRPASGGQQAGRWITPRPASSETVVSP